MTRIHSYNRLAPIYEAISQAVTYGVGRAARPLRYIVNDNYVNDLNEANALAADLTPSLAALGAMYVRLLKEDAALANQGVMKVAFAFDLNAGTLEELAASGRAEPYDPEKHRNAANGSVYLATERAVMLPADNTVEYLAEAFPHFEFRLNLPRGGYSGTLSYRLREDAVPEADRRLLATMNRSWVDEVVGPVYSATTAYDTHREHSYGVGANGRLYSAPAGQRFIFSYLPQMDSLERILTKARAGYREAILERMRAWRNEAPDRDAEARRNEALAQSQIRFEQFRAKMQTASVPEVLIGTLPFVEANKGIKSSRRWGIEVETGAGRDLSGVPDQWDSKGDGSLESSYGDSYIDPEDCENADQHQADIQVRREDNGTMLWVENPDYLDPYDCDSCGDNDGDYDDDDCVELVSPILNSMHSRGLRQICEDLENTPWNDTAGVHVHVEAKDLAVRQIKELVMGYDHIEHLLEASYKRNVRGYCKRRAASELLKIVRQPDVANPRNMSTGDRYVTVNLNSLYSHGTIEFRAMGPYYNYDHLIRWAMFCREFVNVFKAGATSKEFARVKGWDDVLAIFAKYGTEYNFATIGQMESENEFEDFEVTV